MPKANYITCPKGHPLKVIWDKERNIYGFTCDECDVHSLQGFCLQNETVVEVKVVAYGLPKGYRKPI